jgi:hypothetical protein
MDPTRHELRLLEVQGKLDALRKVSRDDFNLAARYRSLVTLEEILRLQVTQDRTASSA